MRTDPDGLARDLDAAVGGGAAAAVCDAVKRALVAFIARGGELPAKLLRPHARGYARRLLHRDPAGRYTVVLMVWAPRQGTPIHDHAGLWCVECVYSGRIRVTSYRVTETLADGRLRLVREDAVTAGVGAAGALIPPFDHHVIDNPFDEPAATLHVYGGEMERCDVFTDAGDGAFRRESRELCYTVDGGRGEPPTDA